MEQKFNKIYQLVSSDDFLSNLSTGGEIPFYLITYDVRQETDLSQSITLLTRRMQNDGKSTLVIDLYELMLNTLTEDDDIEDYYGLEDSTPKKEFTRSIQLAVDVERAYIPNIAKAITDADPDLVLIKGVGKVFPFIRSHTIVNNMENIIKQIPVVLFYPGTYEGTQLSLFGRIKSENHYRAINIKDIQLYKKS